MKSENINNTICSKDMQCEVNKILDTMETGDDIILNDVDPDFCMDAKTFFKVINDYAKSIQK